MLAAVIALSASGLVGSQPARPTAESAYLAEINQWHAARLAALTADDGWLTVAGLFWLKEGSNTAGSDKGNRILLPASAPARLGTFEFHQGTTAFHAAPGVGVMLNGQPVTDAVLKPDSSGEPDVLTWGPLSLFVIQRGNRYALRLRDKLAPQRQQFAGLRYFPVDEHYRVKAKWVPYSPPQKIPVPNILGEIEEELSPGYLEFSLQGHACRLDPLVEDGRLFIIFKDLTAGRETYPTGRFLSAEMPRPGQDEVILDFNKAYNPPCAFTPYATCPLPPQQNVLSVRIEAGELRYGH